MDEQAVDLLGVNSLLFPVEYKEDIAKLNVFQREVNAWKEFVTQAKKVITPPDQIQEKGDFPYASFEYMETLMDKFHPKRAVHVMSETYDPVAYLYTFTVEITDLLTKECRAGTGAHPMIVYESGGQTLKPPTTIRQLMANAKKAALTEAIRDAYAHFGIAADLYGMTPRERPTEEQQDRFEKIIVLLPDDIKKTLRDKWLTHYENTAEAFIIDVQIRTDKWKETHSKPTETGGTDAGK